MIKTSIFWRHLLVVIIIWLPGVLAVIGASKHWNGLIIFALILGQAGLIATLVALLEEVANSHRN